MKGKSDPPADIGSHPISCGFFLLLQTFTSFMNTMLSLTDYLTNGSCVMRSCDHDKLGVVSNGKFYLNGVKDWFQETLEYENENHNPTATEVKYHKHWVKYNQVYTLPDWILNHANGNPRKSKWVSFAGFMYELVNTMVWCVNVSKVITFVKLLNIPMLLQISISCVISLATQITVYSTNYNPHTPPPDA